ncbi:metallo-beta-lactamase domain protein [Purpureocillium lavendulum]|uniref:Metallo-beta-lactamase domain protein n=1 Tax=Purpureocillium lavendulum TaxID=1247861 RepID=A0AB34FVJ7_9HYPO|nr:metallo-beta-lactamase domain protein [Purpureocillium lavendulum]
MLGLGCGLSFFQLRSGCTKHKDRPDDARVYIVEVLAERMFKVVGIIVQIMEDTGLEDPATDVRREAAVIANTPAQHVGAVDDAVGRHVVLDVREDGALLLNRGGYAVKQVVHGHGVELVLHGEPLEDVRLDAAGIGPTASLQTEVERRLLQVVARSATNVEVVDLAGVGTRRTHAGYGADGHLAISPDMALRIPFDESYWQEYLAGQESQLPVLPDVQDVSSRVIRVLAGNPGVMQLQGTNTYLVGSDRITALLAERKIDIAYVLLTHWHGDHTGGVPDLIKRNPKMASRIYKDRPDRNQNPIRDGQLFQVEGASVRAVSTPGHANDHMCFLLEEENALFTGDNVLGHGFSVVQDLAEYMRSLARMAALGCAAGYPAHGDRIHNLPAKMREYINHNQMRVDRVFSALSWSKDASSAVAKPPRAGMTLPEIARFIYGDVPPDLVENAIVPFLLQVLWKLTEDRKVGFEPGDIMKRRWFGLCGVTS